MLKNDLLGTHNPGVKYLLEALKLLYKVSAMVLFQAPVGLDPNLWNVCQFVIKYEIKKITLGLLNTHTYIW